jgi:hypothetical protein
VICACKQLNAADACSTLDLELRKEVSQVSPLLWALLALGLAYLTATPGVIQGAYDYYIVGPFLQFTQPQLRRQDVKIGQKLAQGGFGTVYMGESGKTIPGKINKGEVCHPRSWLALSANEIRRESWLTSGSDQWALKPLGRCRHSSVSFSRSNVF